MKRVLQSLVVALCVTAAVSAQAKVTVGNPNQGVLPVTVDASAAAYVVKVLPPGASEYQEIAAGTTTPVPYNLTAGQSITVKSHGSTVTVTYNADGTYTIAESHQNVNDKGVLPPA